MLPAQHDRGGDLRCIRGSAGGHYVGAFGGLVLTEGNVLEGVEVVEGVGASGGLREEVERLRRDLAEAREQQAATAGCWPSSAAPPRTSTPCWRPWSTAPATSAGPTSPSSSCSRATPTGWPSRRAPSPRRTA